MGLTVRMTCDRCFTERMVPTDAVDFRTGWSEPTKLTDVVKDKGWGYMMVGDGYLYLCDVCQRGYDAMKRRQSEEVEDLYLTHNAEKEAFFAPVVTHPDE